MSTKGMRVGASILLGAVLAACSTAPVRINVARRTPSNSRAAQLAWLTKTAKPINLRLNADQNEIDHASSATYAIKGYADLDADLGSADDKLAAVHEPGTQIAPDAAIVVAWTQMIQFTSAYASVCGDALSANTPTDAACVAANDDLNSAILAWNKAVATLKGVPYTHPTITTIPAPPTTTTTESAASYKAACSNQMPYVQLIKDPNQLTGQCITETGEVYQFDTNTGLQKMLVAIDGDGFGSYTDNVEVKLPTAAMGNNIYQNDIVQFWGPIAGADTYKSTAGDEITVPVVNARYLTLVSGAQGAH